MNYFAQTYTTAHLMTKIDHDKLQALEDEFTVNTEGIELSKFVWLLMCSIAHPSNEKFELIFTERERIKSFLEQGAKSLNFKNLICLSIGGSRLGPELLNEFQALDASKYLFLL